MLLVLLRHLTTGDKWLYAADIDNPRCRATGPGVWTRHEGARHA